MSKTNRDLVTRRVCRMGYLVSALIFTIVFLTFVFLSKSTSHSNNEAPTVDDVFEYSMYDVALAFGDSITQRGSEYENSGWLIHMNEAYTRRMDILNRGFSGYNTEFARKVAPFVFPSRRDNVKKTEPLLSVANARRWLSKRTNFAKESLETHTKKGKWPDTDFTFPGFYPKVQLCILFFGANDAADPRDYRHVPLNKYAENLRYIINMLRDQSSAKYSPETRILVITPPAVGEKMTKDTFLGRGWTYNPHNNTVTKSYAEAAIEVAREKHLPYVDMWSAIEQRVHSSRKRELRAIENSTLPSDRGRDDTYGELLFDTMGVYDGYDRYLLDGLHLNRYGNRVLYKLIKEEIERNWPELNP